MQPLKVAMIGLRSLTASGGIETMVKQVAVRAARMPQLALTVFCRSKYNPQRADRHESVRLVNVPTIYTKHLETFVHTPLATAAALLRGNRVFHYQALGPALFSFLPRLLGRRSIVTVHGLDWKRGKWGPLARSVLKFAEICALRFPNRTVVCSRTLQRHFRDRHGCDVIYIPNAIDPTPAVPLQRLSHLPIEKGRYILFLGRIVPEKGLRLLIDAFERIDTDMKLVVVGDAHFDKNYGRDLMERVRGNQRILFTGALFGDDKEAVLSNAYAFMLPSFIEGMSIVLLEAMGHGICPLVSDIEENLEVIEPLDSAKPAGLSFRCGDADSLQRELEHLLANPELARRIGENAREKVLREYNWDRIAEQYAAIYREAAAPSKGSRP